MKLYKVTFDKKGGYRFIGTDDPKKIYDKYPDVHIVESIESFELINGGNEWWENLLVSFAILTGI